MTEQVPSERFAIGEVAIFCRPGSINFGTEVTITGPLKEWRLNEFDGSRRMAMAYRVEGIKFPSRPRLPVVVEPRDLRKKRPPREDLQIVRWDECPWQPENINV